ncbi:hypothetical protein B0T20DRAFT_114200 [Sordaria brevicollis]|uniref:DUF7587 domain-containing protein n=1 Tax=Sordaria brevicollis TaxID=83679 RepID=A0AAE0UFE1_SORBR|nr:hypothetical protein B0T20DRAFT_114200 [Sordaria brevicollis]
MSARTEETEKTMASAIFWHLASPDQPIVSLVLPQRFFYVRHRYSQAEKTKDGGFIARSPDRPIGRYEFLKENVTKHLGWSNRDDSCFISVFGDQHHAENWANLRRNAVVYELDTAKLPPGTLVLNVFMLCAHLGIKYDFNKNMDEFLFYQGIPGCCVGGCWDIYPWNWGNRPESPSFRFSYQLPWSSVGFHAKRLKGEYKAQLQLANSNGDQETAPEQEPEAEEGEQGLTEENTQPIPDEEVDNLVGEMASLGLQTDVDTHTSNATTATATAGDSICDAGIAPPTQRRQRTVGSIRRERRRQRELEEEEQRRQQVAEACASNSNDPDASCTPGLAQREREEECEVEEDDAGLSRSSTNGASAIPNTATPTAATETDRRENIPPRELRELLDLPPVRPIGEVQRRLERRKTSFGG